MVKIDNSLLKISYWSKMCPSSYGSAIHIGWVLVVGLDAVGSDLLPPRSVRFPLTSYTGHGDLLGVAVAVVAIGEGHRKGMISTGPKGPRPQTIKTAEAGGLELFPELGCRGKGSERGKKKLIDRFDNK